MVLLALSVGVLLTDQLTKYAVLGELTTALDGGGGLGAFWGAPPEKGFDGYHYRQKRTVTVSESFFRLRYAENPGAAFGLLRGLPEGLRTPFFHLVSLGAVVLIGYYFSRLTGAKEEAWAFFGLPLVLGGALGNYVDRLSRGFVIDFAEAHWFDKAAWPSFNVADSAIVVGVGLLVVDAFVRREGKAPQLATAPQEHST